MDEKKIRTVVEEAAKILYDYPELTHKQAIKKAKEMIENGENTSMDKVKEVN